MSDSDDDEPFCPLCIQALDATDKAINYCVCGYQMCLWCWHQLMETAAKDNIAGRCPNCRTVYDKEKIEMHAITPELLEEERRKKKEEKKKGGRGIPKGKQDLAHVRVVQRNLVYAVGLPLHICREEALAEKQYFGQFGKTKKISVNRTGLFAQSQTKTTATGSAYVTYTRNEDAVRCIEAIDGATWDGKPIRACFGTTKYCNAFLKGVPCNNPDCLYLHDIANEDDSFNKDDMNNGTLSKHIMQLVHPLAGDRSKGVNLGKPPAPMPQPFNANIVASGAESSSMTQLGKAQAGPSHINPWTNHLHHVAIAEPVGSPRGTQKPPPVPNLADQEWPTLGAAMDEPDKDRGHGAEADGKIVGAAPIISRTSSLNGDLTVADAVKAAIAAATATKPAAKQAVAKPATQTITLTKPTKTKSAATAVAAAKAKVQLQAATQVAPTVNEPSTSAAAAVAAAAAAVTPVQTATPAPSSSRVAAAVEAALQPPSPSPSCQQAAVTTATTKPHKASLVDSKSTSTTPTIAQNSQPWPSEDLARESVHGSSASSSSSQQTSTFSEEEEAAEAAPAAPTGKKAAAAEQPPPETRSSMAEAHPLSRTSSLASETSTSDEATTPASSAPPSATQATADNTAIASLETADVTPEQTSAIGLISSNDPTVSPPVVAATSNASSASLASWLTHGETSVSSLAIATPVVSPTNSAPRVCLPLLDPVLDPPFTSKPTVPPGFDGPTLLKPPTLGATASARGPPPGFSQPWQPASQPAGSSSFDVDMFFSSSGTVAEPPGRTRKQSRFRFAQNGSTGFDTESCAPSSDFSLPGLPGIDEEHIHQPAAELDILRKLFPTAKLNIVPTNGPAPQLANGPEPPAPSAPWPITTTVTDPTANTSFPMMHTTGSPASATPPQGNFTNPGLALLQKLQRAARADVLTSTHTPLAPTSGLLQPAPAVNAYVNPSQASQPLPSSFLDPAIINAKAAPDLGPTPTTHQSAWQQAGFDRMSMQYTQGPLPPASMQMPPQPIGSQPMYGQPQHSSMLGDASMYGYLSRQGLVSQQPPGYPPPGMPAARAQQRGPPPGFTPGNTSFTPSYSDYGNAFNLMQGRPAPPAASHMYGAGDHYQAGSNLMGNGTDVSKGYLFPTRI